MALGIAGAVLLGAQPPDGGLDIYWIDVEGGAAALIAKPARLPILQVRSGQETPVTKVNRIASFLNTGRDSWVVCPSSVTPSTGTGEGESMRNLVVAARSAFRRVPTVDLRDIEESRRQRRRNSVRRNAVGNVRIQLGKYCTAQDVEERFQRFSRIAL